MNTEIYGLIMKSDLGPGTKIMGMMIAELVQRLPPDELQELIAKCRIVATGVHPSQIQAYTGGDQAFEIRQ